MVQNKEQYAFVYATLRREIQERLGYNPIGLHTDHLRRKAQVVSANSASTSPSDENNNNSNNQKSEINHHNSPQTSPRQPQSSPKQKLGAGKYRSFSESTELKQAVDSLNFNKLIEKNGLRKSSALSKSEEI